MFKLHVIPERGEEGVAKVRELTNGEGVHVVLKCVGLKPALRYEYWSCAVISRVGVPQYDEAAVRFGSLFGSNITLTEDQHLYVLIWKNY